MLKYAKVIDENTKIVEVGIGTNEEFYKSIGMEFMEVEQDWRGQFYVKGFAPEKTPEEESQDNFIKAKDQAMFLLSSRIMATVAQTATFTSAEFAIMAKAKIFESWKADETYSAGYRIEHNGVVYEVVQEVTSIENQPPDAKGMLAIYRPLSVDPSTGTEPDGTKEYPYAYIYGMDVKKDCYYTYNGKLYIAKADMPACVWNPDTSGLWQWEEVNE